MTHPGEENPQTEQISDCQELGEGMESDWYRAGLPSGLGEMFCE